MDTLRCIHNILTAGIFVLFCLVCFLVNKCCCQIGSCGDHCVCLGNKIETESEHRNEDSIKTPTSQQSEKSLNSDKRDLGLRYIDHGITKSPKDSEGSFTSTRSMPEDNADKKIKSAKNSKESVTSRRSMPEDDVDNKTKSTKDSKESVTSRRIMPEDDVDNKTKSAKDSKESVTSRRSTPEDYVDNKTKSAKDSKESVTSRRIMPEDNADKKIKSAKNSKESVTSRRSMPEDYVDNKTKSAKDSKESVTSRRIVPVGYVDNKTKSAKGSKESVTSRRIMPADYVDNKTKSAKDSKESVISGRSMPEDYVGKKIKFAKDSEESFSTRCIIPEGYVDKKIKFAETGSKNKICFCTYIPPDESTTENEYDVSEEVNSYNTEPNNKEPSEIITLAKIKPNNKEPSEMTIASKTGYNRNLYTCDVGGATICPEMYLQSVENKSESESFACSSCAVLQAKSYDSHGQMSVGYMISNNSKRRSCQNSDIESILVDDDIILSSHIKACNACIQAEVQVSDKVDEYSETVRNENVDDDGDDVIIKPIKQQEQETIVEAKNIPLGYTTQADKFDFSKQQEQGTSVGAKKDPRGSTARVVTFGPRKQQVKGKKNSSKTLIKSSSDESDEIVEHKVKVKVRVFDSDLPSDVQRTHEHTTSSGTKISIIGPIHSEDHRHKKVYIGSPPRECVRVCPRVIDSKNLPPCIYEEEILPFANVPCSRTYEEYDVGAPRTYMKDVSVGVDNNGNDNKDHDMYPPKDKTSISSTSTHNSSESSTNQSDKGKFKFDNPYNNNINRKRKNSSEFYKEDKLKLKPETKRMYDEIRTDKTNRNPSTDVSEDDTYSDNLDKSIHNDDPGKFIDKSIHNNDPGKFIDKSIHNNDPGKFIDPENDEDYIPFLNGKCSEKCLFRKYSSEDNVSCKYSSSPTRSVSQKDSTVGSIEETGSETGYSSRERRYSTPNKRRKVCPWPVQDMNDGRQVSDATVVFTEGNVTEFPPVAEDVSSTRLCGEKICDGPVCPTSPVSSAYDNSWRSVSEGNETNNDTSRQRIKTSPTDCGSRCMSQREFIPFDEEVNRLYKKYADNESYKSSPSSCGKIECDCDEIIRLMHAKYGTATTISKRRIREANSQETESLSIYNPIDKKVSTNISSSSGKKTYSKKKNKENVPKYMFTTSPSTSKQYYDTQQYSEESIIPNEIYKYSDEKSGTALDNLVPESKRKLQIGFCYPDCPRKRLYSNEENIKEEDETLVFNDYDSVPVKKQKIGKILKERVSNKQVVFNKNVEESGTTTDKRNNDESSCKSVCPICRQIIDQLATDMSEEDIGHIQREEEDEIHCSVYTRLSDIEDKYDSKIRCQGCLEAIRSEMNRTDTEKLSDDSDISTNVLKCKNFPKSLSNITDLTSDINSTKSIIRIRPFTCFPCNCNSYNTKRVSSKVTIMSKCNTSVEDYTDNKEYLKNNKNPLLRIKIDLDNPKTEGSDNDPYTPDKTDYDKLSDLPPDNPSNDSGNNPQNIVHKNCSSSTDIRPGESVLEYVNRMRRNCIIPYPYCYKSWPPIYSAPSTSSTVRMDENLSPNIEEESYTISTEEQNPIVDDSDDSLASISNEKKFATLSPIVSEPEKLNRYIMSLEKENNKSNLRKKKKQPEKNVMKYFSDRPTTAGAEYGKFYPYRKKYKRPMSQPQACPPDCKYCSTNNVNEKYHVTTDQPQSQVKSVNMREMDINSADKSSYSYLHRDSNSSLFQNCHPNCSDLNV